MSHLEVQVVSIDQNEKLDPNQKIIPVEFDPDWPSSTDAVVLPEAEREHVEYSARRGFPHTPPSNLESVVLADVSLKVRGLVGIVLGSRAGDFLAPPDDVNDLQSKESDLDVLILQPFSSRHPSPGHLGIDFFARHPDGIDSLPTNGNVRLWYDLHLKDGMTVADESTSEAPIVLRTESGELVVRKNVATEIGQNQEIEPGLYLPSQEVLEAIKLGSEERISILIDRISRFADDIEASLDNLLKEESDDKLRSKALREAEKEFPITDEEKAYNARYADDIEEMRVRLHEQTASRGRKRRSLMNQYSDERFRKFLDLNRELRDFAVDIRRHDLLVTNYNIEHLERMNPEECRDGKLNEYVEHFRGRISNMRECIGHFKRDYSYLLKTLEQRTYSPLYPVLGFAQLELNFKELGDFRDSEQR